MVTSVNGVLSVSAVQEVEHRVSGLLFCTSSLKSFGSNSN